MGENYPLPKEVAGYSFAGFVPFAIFALTNGSGMWGVIGIVATVLGLYPIYSVVFGLLARPTIWRARKFESVRHFQTTMIAWDVMGFLFFLVDVACVVGIYYGYQYLVEQIPLLQTLLDTTS